MMSVIGLTGKACAGKNQYGKALEKQGLLVVDVDVLGHEVLRLKAQEIATLFPLARKEDGSLDRKVLGTLAFSDKNALEKLNALIHPAVKKMCEDIIQKEQQGEQRIVVLNAAMLKKGKLDVLCDEIVFVKAPFFVRYRRTKKRDQRGFIWFLKRDFAQRNINEKSFSSKIRVVSFKNSGGIEKIYRQISNYCDILKTNRCDTK